MLSNKKIEVFRITDNTGIADPTLAFTIENEDTDAVDYFEIVDVGGTKTIREFNDIIKYFEENDVAVTILNNSDREFFEAISLISKMNQQRKNY